MVAGLEGRGVIDSPRGLHSAPGANVELQAGIGLSAAGQNEHHSPIGTAEYPGKRLFVGRARSWTGAGVGMGPDPGLPGTA